MPEFSNSFDSVARPSFRLDFWFLLEELALSGITKSCFFSISFLLDQFPRIFFFNLTFLFWSEVSADSVLPTREPLGRGGGMAAAGVRLPGQGPLPQGYWGSCTHAAGSLSPPLSF